MKKHIVIILTLIGVASFIAVPLKAQDSVYGDYLISSVQKSISLDLEDANLVDVLKLLSQQTSLNFISTEAVKERKLTLYLDKVPLKEALDIMFKANNLTYEFYPEGNIFVVKEMGKPTMELVTKVYRLQYVRVKSGRLQKEIKDHMQDDNLHITTSASTSGGSGGSGGGSGGSGGGGGGDDEEGAKESGLKKAIERVLTEYGKITEDPITNSIVVVDVPSQFPLIEEVVKSLDIAVHKVMVEVEMLDVSKATMKNLGIRWPSQLVGLDVTGTKFVDFPFGKSAHVNSDEFRWGGTYRSPVGAMAPWGNALTVEVDPPDSIGWSGSHFTPSILTVLGTQLTLNFLTSQQDTKILARPKILTLSNETAEVKIATNEAIGLTVTESETGGTQITVERAETGVRLRVTPIVNPVTKEITLFVTTFNTDANPSNFSINTAVAAGQILNPEERSTKATARLQNGENLLLGGLIKKKSDETVTKVPFFGDLPIIGKAFKHKNVPLDKNQERELLVFLTPRIIEDNPMMLASDTSVTREQDSFRRDSIGVVLDKFAQ